MNSAGMVSDIKRALSATIMAIGLLGAEVARAAPEENQVYMNEMDAPGEVGLDLHNNCVLSGISALDAPGGQDSLHLYRLTPEFSLGLSLVPELGAYLGSGALAALCYRDPCMPLVARRVPPPIDASGTILPGDPDRT